MVSIREYVAHMPSRQRELLARPVRLLPVNFRYGPVYRESVREINKARTVPSWARAQVEARLGRTLLAAVSTTYCRGDDRYEPLRAYERGELSEWEALARLPILTREDISARYRDLLTVPESEVELSASSGTSGDPIFFMLDRNRGAREWAYVVDAWSETGYRLGDWRVFFRGLDLPGNRPYFVMGSTGEIVIRLQTINAQTVRDYWRMIETRGIEFLHGYPSTLTYVARLLEDADFDTSWRYRIRGLLPVSEQYTPAQGETLRRVFPNAKISVFYGLSEKTVFAVMDHHGIYSPYPLYGHVELVNQSGEPVSVGERGRIVTTTLDGRGMPLVRYDTGDSAQLVGYDSIGTPQFKDVTSRRGREGIVTANGSLFATTPFNVHGHEFECVRRFKIRQEVPGKATLLVQPSATATPAQLETFRTMMENRTQNQVELDFELVEELPETPNGKHTLLDQRIPNAPRTWA